MHLGAARQPLPPAGVAAPGEEMQLALPEPVERLGQPARVHAGPGRAGRNSRDVEEEAHRQRV